MAAPAHSQGDNNPDAISTPSAVQTHESELQIPLATEPKESEEPQPASSTSEQAIPAPVPSRRRHSESTVGLPGSVQPTLNPRGNFTPSTNDANPNTNPWANFDGHHTHPAQRSSPTIAGRDASSWWKIGGTPSYGSITSDTRVASSRSVDGNASSQKSAVPTASPTVGLALPAAVSSNPYECHDNVSSGRSIRIERRAMSENDLTVNEEWRLPIRDRHWHSSAVTLRTPISFWISAKWWTPTIKAQVKVNATNRLATEAPANAAARARATTAYGAGGPPTLWKWPPPERACTERFKRGFSKYRIRKNHIDAPPGQDSKCLGAAFETWISSSSNDDIWVQAYSAWDALQGDIQQPILPASAPNNGDRQPLGSGKGAEQPVPLWRQLLCLRGGAGTPEPLDDEPLEEDEPANGPGGSHIRGHEDDHLAEDILNEPDNGSRIDDQGERIPNESGNSSRNGFILPDINDPSWIPANDYGTYVYVPGSPKSHYSALSGDSSDLSDAASLHFHEQNAKAEEERGTATRLDGVSAALGRLPNESRIFTPGDGRDDGSDYSSTRATRRRFSFESRPSSGSRSKRTSSNLDGSIDWLPQSSAPRDRRTDSDVDEVVDAMGEDEPLINPHPAPEPATNDISARVPSLEHAHNHNANVHPTVPFAGVRRRDLLRHALRRDQLWEHVLRALRNMLVMGPEEKKRSRKKK
ncbi:hypothetical protein B0T12DRAFT_518065 [Alternaria alternata]|nr:hypothetical protein B0T12DRAFT_518065 [Alternaria alternata]